jgi:farnesyl-diphosphate farnesyltransferase
MLCNLFIEEISGLSSVNKKIMRNTAVSFGLGLQITNISKDIVADRGRGWSYVPLSYIEANGLSFEEFHAGKSTEKDLKVLETLLNKTVGHLTDAFDFILAIPKSYMRIRLFCIWPLWMAMKTVAELHKNHDLLKSNANVKISRKAVKQILRRTPFICWSDSLLRRSFKKILKDKEFTEPEHFDLNKLKQRLKKLALDDLSHKPQEV